MTVGENRGKGAGGEGEGGRKESGREGGRYGGRGREGADGREGTVWKVTLEETRQTGWLNSNRSRCGEMGWDEMRVI